jgi:hypothetical protein
MSTKLFLTDNASDYNTGNNDAKLNGSAGIWQNRALSTTAGTPLATSNNVSTVAGPTNGIEVTVGTILSVWYSAPLNADVTISGSITWNIWAAESSNSANVAINGRIEKVDGATGAITLIDATARTTEVALTTRAVNNFAETPAAGVACKRGDRLRVRVYGDDAGTMATGFTFIIGYNGPTAAADGDTWVQLTENLTFVAEPAATQVFPTDTAGPTLPAISLLSDFTGADENPLSDGGNWATLSTAGLQRISNAAAASSTGPVCVSYWTPTSFGSIEAYVTLATLTGANGIVVRGGSPGSSWTGYLLRTTTTQQILQRWDAGIAAANLLTTALSIASGDQLGISADGSTFRAYYRPSAGSWTLLGTATDATYATGRAGLFSTNASGRMDDFYVGLPAGTFGLVTREAWTSRGAGVQTDVTNTVAGFTAPIQVTDTAGGTVVDWFTRPLTAFTLGGAVRVNVRGLESLNANAGPRCEVAVVAGDGTGASVWATGGSGTLPEFTTSEAARSFLIAGDDTAISDGQRLRIRFYIDDADTGYTAGMAAGGTVTLYYAGAAAATGDTYLTFTQTLTEFVAAADVVPFGRIRSTSSTCPSEEIERHDSVVMANQTVIANSEMVIIHTASGITSRASFIRLLRAWCSQAGTATSQMLGIQLALQASAFGTYTATTPAPTVVGGNVSGITGGTAGAAATAGTDSSANAAGTKTPLVYDAFNNLNGWLWVPVPEERIAVPSDTAIVLALVGTPTTLTNWNAGIVYEEVN